MNFIEGFSKVTRTDTFVNSGVGLEQELDPSQLDFAVIGDSFQDFFQNRPWHRKVNLVFHSPHRNEAMQEITKIWRFHR